MIPSWNAIGMLERAATTQMMRIALTARGSCDIVWARRG